MKRFLVFVLAILVLVLGSGSCHLFDGPPVSPLEYPCGTQGRSCGGGMCCADTEVCGAAGTSRPAGACCYAGGSRPQAKVFAATTPGQDAALAKAVRALVAAESAPAPTTTVPPPVPTPTATVPPPAPAPSGLGALYNTKTFAAVIQLDAAAPKSPDESTFFSATSETRAYYDTVRALLDMFARTGEARYRTDSIRESAAYRATLVWSGGGKYACVPQSPAWSPSVLLDPAALRRLYVEGQVAEFRLTGSAEARAAAIALANTIVASLPMLTAPRSQGRPVLIEQTERNLAFALLGVTAAAQLDGPTFLPSVQALLARAIAWSERSPSGCWEHDLVAHDPAECTDGPNGCSPFMGALLAEAIARANAIAPHAGAAKALLRFADYLTTPASQTLDGRGWRYLERCKNEGDGPIAANQGYAVQWTEDLNALVIGGLAWGARANPSQAARLFVTGDKMAGIALDTYWARKSPKHFAQDVRGLGAYVAVREGRPF